MRAVVFSNEYGRIQQCVRSTLAMRAVVFLPMSACPIEFLRAKLRKNPDVRLTFVSFFVSYDAIGGKVHAFRVVQVQRCRQD